MKAVELGDRKVDKNFGFKGCGDGRILLATFGAGEKLIGAV